jgi:rod shape-determining protein MreC
MNFKDLKSIFLSLLLVIFLAWFFIKPIANLISYSYLITGKLIYDLGSGVNESQGEVKDYIDSLSTIKELNKKLDKTKLDNIKLRAGLKKLKLESLNKRKQLEIPFPTIRSQVIGRSPESWHKQIIINKGKKDGVEVGSGVFSLNGIVGQVNQVFDHTAIVKLIFDKSFQMGAKIERTEEYGVLSGSYPDYALLDFIRIDSSVQVGDRIVSTGLCLDETNCPFPTNFPIGKVVKIKKDPNTIGLIVKIKFFETLNTIKDLYILT